MKIVLPHISRRIAMVAACPFPAPQGSQALIKETVTALQGRGHEVRLVVYGHGTDEAWDAAPIHRCMRLPGYRKTAAGPSIWKPIADAALVMTLRRVVREHAIDVVHAHNYEGLLAALFARVRPVVYHAHNAMVDELPYFMRPRRWAQRFGSALDRSLPRRADAIVAPHGELADYLVAECACRPDQVSIVPPSCKVDRFGDNRKLGDSPRVLYMGNLDSYQNLPFLQQAMTIVRQTLPDARLTVATSAHCDLPDVDVMASAGFSAVREALQEDVVVACPRKSWSGYPIKLLNAMAAGKPVVAHRGCAHPIAPGVDGLVADTPEAFAEDMIRLLRDKELRAHLGDKARETIMREHSPEICAAKLERVYDSVLRDTEH